ncbi:asparagine synthase (glutamine-hydrolyzing) [Methylocystis echinoides]|uniref:asparagine synthase (glutamine-hydrolyzing) n=1 Tax=Methylocystis echinoides TaxID=29468 RepID=A0A9W6GQM8_9HYPH|nr:asparagine synthase (glutamine-hydrolyzing) [Methylocystis echinoides]GLI91143.1 asparagine synthetase B [Methylocystis echinoides]
MCGINGIFAYHYAANPVDQRELLRSRDHMSPRGPDGAGLWLSDDERIGFGHRRLAIIDLSDAAAQPMRTNDGRFTVTFNGEIYNYRELRSELEAKGRVFTSHSDTEVLLHLYAERGADMTNALRGMFAFSIWDEIRRTLFLARDPYGIKPLYYVDDGWTFRFASQVKALIAGGAIARDPEPAGLVGFYLLGSVPEPFTIYAGVRCLPAGATMVVDRTGAQEPRAYHSIPDTYALPPRMLVGVQASAQIASALRDSVARHLVADVPVGAFLSAGVDSGALVGLMRDAGASEIKTTTVTFEEFRKKAQDEGPLAGEIARRYGTDHECRLVTRAEFKSDLPRIIEAMDQPSIDGINTWFVAKAAHERGLKVAVSGLGGDELFGGYPSFRDIPRWVRMLSLPSRLPLAGAAMRQLAMRIIGKLGVNPKAAGLLELGGSWAGAYLLKRGLYMPWELEQVLDRDLVETGLRRLQPLELIGKAMTPRPTSGFGCVASLEASLYMRNQLLRDTDWASMAHSLEVRVPLVDSVLLSQCAPLSANLENGAGKRILASAPTQPLPEAVVSRSKTGFTTPLEQWMREQPRHRDRYDANVETASKPWARTWSRQVAANAFG